MEWLILAALYVAVGIGVFAWNICSNEALRSDQKIRSGKILILFPELCLFWPIALISKSGRKRERIKHTKRTLCITILLLVVAAGFQYGVYLLARKLGFPNGGFMCSLITMIPGCAGWFVAFWYAFNLPHELVKENRSE